MFKITKLTAFVAVDPADGDEGVMSYRFGDQWYPLVCADEARIKSLFPLAQEISQATGVPFRVLQFSGRENVTDQIVKKYS